MIQRCCVCERLVPEKFIYVCVLCGGPAHFDYSHNCAYALDELRQGEPWNDAGEALPALDGAWRYEDLLAWSNQNGLPLSQFGSAPRCCCYNCAAPYW